MNIKRLLTSNTKILIGIVVVLAVAGAGLYIYSNTRPILGTYNVARGNIVASVNLPGTVSPSNSVDLSFQEAGKISRVYVKDGDLVKEGDALASLDNSTQLTQLSQAKAALATAQANYDKLIAGPTPEDVKAAQNAVTSAQQNLDAAYNGALAALTSVSTAANNAYTTVFYLQNKYFSASDQDSAQVRESKNSISNDLLDISSNSDSLKVNSNNSAIDSALSSASQDLNEIYANLKIIRDVCDHPIYYFIVSAVDKASLDLQKTNVNTALTSIASSQQNTASLKLALQKAQDQLNITTAPPTQNDIDVAKAQISSAQAQVDNAQLAVQNATIKAPFPGTTRNVTAQLGQVVSPNIAVLSIINNGMLKIDAYVSQDDVPKLQKNPVATVTLDAYGDSVKFSAKVATIDTAETIFNGSPAYHVTLYFTQPDDRIRVGMTGNVLITSEEHDDVVEIPSRLVLNDGGSDFVIMKNGNENVRRQITLGLTSDNGMVEVVSGLDAGDKIIDF